MTVDAKLLLEIFSVVGVPLAGLYQWWNYRVRSQLRADLDILESLKSLGTKEDSYTIVKAHIDATIAKAYACGRSSKSDTANTSHFNLVDLILFFVFFLGTAFWTLDLVDTGINWRRILIAVGFAFSCLVALLNVTHKRRVSKNVETLVAKNNRSLSDDSGGIERP